MDKYRMLSHISCNFNKLFSNCTDASIFIEPSLTTSNDIDTLIILNQIVDVICNKGLSFQNMIVYNTLEKIISIKFDEYCQCAILNNINYDLNNFKLSFNDYICNICTDYKNGLMIID